MRIALAVSGGIAAYKAAELSRLLVQRGHEVQPILTGAAQEFVTPLTLATLTQRKPILHLFGQGDPEALLASAVEHIQVAQESDVLLVAPATANVLAKLVHGLADDFLSTMYLAFRGPVVFAPSMNTQMWTHPATMSNMAVLRSRENHHFVEPGDGFLACGTVGPGRMAEPIEIAKAIDDLFVPATRDFEDHKILITAGPTREAIDPVRYLSNRSSGKMGYALASAAASRGAKVKLISGPVSLPVPTDVDLEFVESAQEMCDAVMAHFAQCTMAILCAAVADFRVTRPFSQKLKKGSGISELKLEPTADILMELGRRKKNQVLVGFAAETENVSEEAQRKLVAKNCDMIVGNLVGGADSAFDSDDNTVVLATGAGVQSLPRASKLQVANQILDEALRLRVA